MSSIQQSQTYDQYTAAPNVQVHVRYTTESMSSQRPPQLTTTEYLPSNTKPQITYYQNNIDQGSLSNQSNRSEQLICGATTPKSQSSGQVPAPGWTIANTYGFTSNNGLTDIEGAKMIAKRIFEKFDKNQRGRLSDSDVISMIVQAYRTFSSTFSPANNDIRSYHSVLDSNKDGQINYQDIENLCIKYLCAKQPTQATTDRTYSNQQQSETIVRNSYSKEVQARLDVARRLFEKFDKDKSGYLTITEIKPLLVETYAQMDVNYTPTTEDVNLWMQMTNKAGDGKVTLKEYEEVLIESMRKCDLLIDPIDNSIVINRGRL